MTAHVLLNLLNELNATPAKSLCCVLIYYLLVSTGSAQEDR